MAKTWYYNVANRSASTVVYKIPEMNIRRTFAPGEVKRLTFEELQKLSYQPGGRELMANFLQIRSEGIVKTLNIPAQPEYYMDENQIVELLKTGSQAEFLDCLDYAPVGVVDLIKKYAVSLPLTDYDKRQALKAKTGFDVDEAIKNETAEKAEEEGTTVTPAAAAEVPGGRRTTGDKYKVISSH